MFDNGRNSVLLVDTHSDLRLIGKFTSLSKIAEEAM